MQRVWDAYAKINWTLDVLCKRPDGYHDLDMLMQSISLYDTLLFDRTSRLTLDIKGKRLSGTDNLILRAANALSNATGCRFGARITLFKRIPVAAGLGGGSADAAATLLALNQLWKLGLSTQQLQAIGLPLGADIPFCIQGGLARARGVGEMLSSIAPIPDWYIVLVKPCAGVSTRDVFTAFNLEGEHKRPDTAGAIRAIEAADIHAFASCLGNTLESVTFEMRPMLSETLDALQAEGALAARMSGSGPTVYGLFPDQQMAMQACSHLRERYDWCWWASLQSQGATRRMNSPAMRSR